jgi:hypothetical protein
MIEQLYPAAVTNPRLEGDFPGNVPRAATPDAAEFQG